MPDKLAKNNPVDTPGSMLVATLERCHECLSAGLVLFNILVADADQRARGQSSTVDRTTAAKEMASCKELGKREWESAATLFGPAAEWLASADVPLQEILTIESSFSASSTLFTPGEGFNSHLIATLNAWEEKVRLLVRQATIKLAAQDAATEKARSARTTDNIEEASRAVRTQSVAYQTAQQVEEEAQRSHWRKLLTAPPGHDPAAMTACAAKLRVLNHPVGVLQREAITLICTAANAGAFVGGEWTVWRNQVAHKPSFFAAIHYLPQLMGVTYKSEEWSRSGLTPGKVAVLA